MGGLAFTETLTGTLRLARDPARRNELCRWSSRGECRFVVIDGMSRFALRDGLIAECSGHGGAVQLENRPGGGLRDQWRSRGPGHG